MEQITQIFNLHTFYNIYEFLQKYIRHLYLCMYMYLYSSHSTLVYSISISFYINRDGSFIIALFPYSFYLHRTDSNKFA